MPEQLQKKNNATNDGDNYPFDNFCRRKVFCSHEPLLSVVIYHSIENIYDLRLAHQFTTNTTRLLPSLL